MVFSTTLLLSPTSTFCETKLFYINEMGLLLVTMGLVPCALGLDDLSWNGEALIDFLDLWFGSCGLSDAQA